jgi:hypothetical protein
MTRSNVLLSATLALALAAVGCGTPPPAPVTPLCQEVSLSDAGLKFRTTLSDGGIEEQGAQAGDKTYINATSGGNATTAGSTRVFESYTYGSFTGDGLKKVSLTDLEALSSVDWDIAFRRANIRVNSGPSGPSNVEVAFAGGADAGVTFTGVTKADGLTFAPESYFDATCTLLPDPHGGSAPATRLAGFYDVFDTGANCLDTSANRVYVLHLRDGKYVKLQVLNFYAPAVQAACNAGGPFDITASSVNLSGNYIITWKYISGP